MHAAAHNSYSCKRHPDATMGHGSYGMLSGEHYVATNFLFDSYYVHIVQVEDMTESGGTK